MNEQCVPIEELVERDRWPAEDLRQSHLDHCPRCQSLLLSYAAFAEPPDLPAGADLDDASVRL